MLANCQLDHFHVQVKFSQVQNLENLEIREILGLHLKTLKSCNADATNIASDWFTSISQCVPVEDEDPIFQIEGLKIYAISLSIRQRNDYLNFLISRNIGVLVIVYLET